MIMDLVKEFIADVIGACLGVVVDWMSLFLLKTNDTSIYPSQYIAPRLED